MSLIYELHKRCLDKFEDRAGVSEIEGGDVLDGEKKIGTYSSVRRTSCVSKETYMAMLWTTLFLLEPRAKTLGNMTLHGARNMKTCGERGSVSAATASFAGNIGKPFKRIGDTLTIG